MSYVDTFLLELEFTIYYLSPDAFRYVVATNFLQAEDEGPCLNT